MNLGILRWFSLLLICTGFLGAREIGNYEFDVVQKGQEDNNTLLVIGGIQGDEPGGFMAASLLQTHYKITKGSVRIVPNLAFYSIIKRGRGEFGDMNRKFAYISKKDPDYKTIQRIKSVMLNKKVAFIVDMHDGSGFYRSSYIDKNHQPNKWGQSFVIDQKVVKNLKYGNLEEIGNRVVHHINSNLIRYKKGEDEFHINNTRTAFPDGDKEMRKTLSYFAIKHGKSAIALESAKEYLTYQRVYYKMLGLEKVMDLMGIEYKRDFKLTPLNVKRMLREGIYVKINDKITLFVSDSAHKIKYLPMNSKIKFESNNPLVVIVNKKKYYQVRYGNRFVSNIFPEKKKYDNSLNSVNLKVDETIKKVKFGDIVKVSDSFEVPKIDGIRVNVIGFTKRGVRNEVNLPVTHKDFIKKYAIDKKKSSFRVEFYKKDRFVGMVVVKFQNRLLAKR